MVSRKDEAAIKGWLEVERSDPKRLLRTYAWVMAEAPPKKIGRPKGKTSAKLHAERNTLIRKKMEQLRLLKKNLSVLQLAKHLSKEFGGKPSPKTICAICRRRS